MARLKNVTSGAVVEVADEKVAGLGSSWVPADGEKSPAPESRYEGQKVDDLKAEIERRNQGRDEADLLSADGKKADLVAALEADDAATK
jgi:hypothetical protein